LRLFVPDSLLGLKLVNNRLPQFINTGRGGVFCNPARIAASAAALTGSGVSKSGSPDEKSATSIPRAAIAFAVAAIAKVGEGVMRPTRAASFMFSSS